MRWVHRDPTAVWLDEYTDHDTASQHAYHLYLRGVYFQSGSHVNLKGDLEVSSCSGVVRIIVYVASKLKLKLQASWRHHAVLAAISADAGAVVRVDGYGITQIVARVGLYASSAIEAWS